MTVSDKDALAGLKHAKKLAALLASEITAYVESEGLSEIDTWSVSLAALCMVIGAWEKTAPGYQEKFVLALQRMPR